MSKATNLTGLEFLAPAPFKSDSKIVFLFHGYGADQSDLVGLKDVLVDEHTSSQNWSWVFPQGPLKVDIGGGWTGRAWWPITLSSLPGDWSDITPPGIESLRESGLTFIESYLKNFDLSWNQVILGGFSQGAMLATELYLFAPKTPKGLLSFSGTLIRKTDWSKQLTQRSGSRVFLSHGEQDSILPVRGTLALNTLFKQNGLSTDFCSFSGGHEIPMKAIDKARHYLQNLA